MEVEKLLHSLGTAVQEAHNAIADKSAESFFAQHFEAPDSNGDTTVYRPKMIKILIPDAHDEGGEQKVLCVPTAVLVPHRNLGLDEVRVNLDIGINENDGRVCSAVNDSNTEHTGSLEIVFKCTDTAEGLARVETQLNGMI